MNARHIFQTGFGLSFRHSYSEPTRSGGRPPCKIPEGEVTDQIVSSGSWGKVFLKNITDLNRGGALENVLGKETLKDLQNVSRTGEVISNAVLKGKTGLAAAAFAASFLFPGMLTAPIATLSGAATILALSKMLRLPSVMKYMSSPRLRAYEAERAAQIGANLGRRDFAAEKARESAIRAIRTVVTEAAYYSADQGANVAEQNIDKLT